MSPMEPCGVTFCTFSMPALGACLRVTASAAGGGAVLGFDGRICARGYGCLRDTVRGVFPVDRVLILATTTSSS